MMLKSCGCTLESCGCCAGIEKLTPMNTVNGAGLDALSYRVGTHGAFLQSMKASLATTTVTAAGADGQTMETFTPLTGLTIRESSDPAIALLDGWATAADVLTFYQERIANEGYLRTATERRSVLELAKLVGYKLRPGVASTVYLAYTLEDTQTEPVEIPAGARAQSIPGPGELPQAFETSEKSVARKDWNNLQARLSRPQNITLDTALAIDYVYVAGANTNLVGGDKLLLVFDASGTPSVLRTVTEVSGDFAEGRSKISLLAVDPAVVAATPALVQFITAATPQIPPNNGAAERMVGEANRILNEVYLGLPTPPKSWAGRMLSSTDGNVGPALDQLFEEFDATVTEILQDLPGDGDSITVTDPSVFVRDLLKPPVPQVRSSAHLGRSLSASARRGSDVQPQLLVNFAPRLKRSYYKAWSNATVNLTAATLQGVFALRLSAPLFGASVPRQPTYNDQNQLNPQSQWLEWNVASDEADNTLYLDQGHKEVLPDSYVLIHTNVSGDTERLVRHVTDAQLSPRTAYGLSGETTRVVLDDPWWDPNVNQLISGTLRRTKVYGQSEQLDLVEEPVTDDVQGNEVELGDLHDEMSSGRWVILSGERADIEAVDGVGVAELLMISGLRHDYDASLPGDTTHTTLIFATDTAYCYKRDTLTIYGNVIKATHGESVQETLGSGNAAQALQAFQLKQPPLTFVPAATAAGAESTLEIYVNNVQWHEAATFSGLNGDAHRFVTKIDDAANVKVIFGNGEQGARLPTGGENITARYRYGIGRSGNVLAGQISLLQSRPLGVKDVINPLQASGGADKENRDQAKQSAPLAVMALDRLVSLQDYVDFTRTFAGIAKADAQRLSDGRRQLIYITVAGMDDIEIEPDSDLYKNLLLALRKLGDPCLPVQVAMRELLILTMSANVRIHPDYQWDPVADEIRATLLDAFGFERRSLGQPAYLSEAVSLIQNVRGVDYVDVDAFGGVPEKTADIDGTRRLLTLDELAEAIAVIVDPARGDIVVTSRLTPIPPGPTPVVRANLGGFDRFGLHPAQLAIFTPNVADMLILNQIT